MIYSPKTVSSIVGPLIGALKCRLCRSDEATMAAGCQICRPAAVFLEFLIQSRTIWAKKFVYICITHQEATLYLSRDMLDGA